MKTAQSKRRSARLAALGAVLALGIAAPAGAVECYRAGNDALDAGRLADAVSAFEVAAELPECSASRPGLLHSKATALHDMARASGEPALACRALEAYRMVVQLEPTSRVGRASQSAIADADARCARGQEPPPKRGGQSASGVRSDRSLEWGLTIGAAGTAAVGGVLLALAVDAADERDAADQRALAQAPGSAEEAAALSDFESASKRTDAFGISGYALLGVGGALAIGAVIAWAVDDGPVVSLMPTPNGATIVGRW